MPHVMLLEENQAMNRMLLCATIASILVADAYAHPLPDRGKISPASPERTRASTELAVDPATASKDDSIARMDADGWVMHGVCNNDDGSIELNFAKRGSGTEMCSLHTEMRNFLDLLGQWGRRFRRGRAQPDADAAFDAEDRDAIVFGQQEMMDDEETEPGTGTVVAEEVAAEEVVAEEVVAQEVVAKEVAAEEKESGPVLFDVTELGNDLIGELGGSVILAQAHTFPALNPGNEKRQHLVGQRKTLVMFKPEGKIDEQVPVSISVTDSRGYAQGFVEMLPPARLAKTVQRLLDMEDAIVDFTYDDSSLEVVDALDDDAIAAALGRAKGVKVSIWDGHWKSAFNLPDGKPELDGKMILFSSRSTCDFSINYPAGSAGNQTATLRQGQTLVFKNVKGVWVTEDDMLFNRISYGEGFWSAILPPEWIRPGLVLSFEHRNKLGRLSGTNVGAPSELLINTIDIGMLVEPRGRFDFQADPAAQREFYETIPVSRLIVNQYEPVHLKEIMLPDGTLLTTEGPGECSRDFGSMRQAIARELISIGINNANYGINSSVGEGEDQHSFMAAQITAHNAQGRYMDQKICVHGGSGGGGIATLDSSIGNELSHGMGRNFGLEHSMGGFDGSAHKPADQTNSTWGWHSGLEAFVPNFDRQRGTATCIGDACIPPFHGVFPMGLDAMAGGRSSYAKQRFTLYTPYSLFHIQKSLESKVLFDKTSSTGFRKWNPVTQTMDEYSHRGGAQRTVRVYSRDLDADADFISRLYLTADKIELYLSDDDRPWGFLLPEASQANKGKVLEIEFGSGSEWHLTVNGGTAFVPSNGNVLYVSDGEQWVRDDGYTVEKELKPEGFGVPVTTLVGYYDPQQEKKGYIFPALHGSFGYVYPDNASILGADDCALLVETAGGKELKYALANNRHNGNSMNKMHVNIARADQPRHATILCAGEVLAEAVISQPMMDPVCRVQGAPLVGVTSAQRAQAEQPVKWVPAAGYESADCACQ